MRCHAWLLTLLVCTGAPLGALADDPPQPQDLKKLSLEELARIDVTSASRRTERLSDIPAAVSVVRQDDVLRSGVTILAEAMRLGDAVDVARVNGTTWAVSMRGFNISTANKLLVLVDGRTTYSPLFGGTFWDVQDMPLADLDRIEFVRGPGGAVWGANAVNGVINIITKPTAATQGSVLTLVAGSDELPIVAARHGGRAGSGHYRVYGKYRRRGENLTASGADANDSVAFGQGGFRFDSDQSQPARWFVSGAGYRGENSLASGNDAEVSGGHLLAQWTRRTPARGEFQVTGYYDRSNRMVPNQFEERRDTADVDAQHEFRAGRHTLVSGAQFQVSRGRSTGSAGFFFDPEAKTQWVTTAFVQDQVELARNRAYLIGGVKAGANDFTGLEVQPTIRVRLHPHARHMAWGAVSRAVRLPTRFDTELRLRNAVTGAVTLAGTETFDAESVVAYEAGYRTMPHPRLTADVAAFTNRYDSLRSQEFRPPVVRLENFLNARTSGVEFSATVQPSERWRVHGSYAWLTKSFTLDPGSTDVRRGRDEANDPSHLAHLRSQLDLPRGFAFDAFLRYAGRRPAPIVDSYAELDLRLGWRPRPNWELSLVGQNLLADSHSEFNFTPLIEFRRGVFLRSIWEF